VVHRPKDPDRDREARSGADLQGSDLPEFNPDDGPCEPTQDQEWMAQALAEASRAGSQGEVPIGAVIVREGRVLARAHNLTRTRQDPTAHAELLAVRRAARFLGYQRLEGSVVYTTVEPCFMCAGALAHARVRRVVFGIRDPKFGGCVSLGRVLLDSSLNHTAEVVEGVGEDEARELMQAFFRSLRGGAG